MVVVIQQAHDMQVQKMKFACTPPRPGYISGHTIKLQVSTLRPSAQGVTHCRNWEQVHNQAHVQKYVVLSSPVVVRIAAAVARLYPLKKASKLFVTQAKASDKPGLLKQMACEQAQCVPRGKLIESKDIKLPVLLSILQT